MKFALVVLASLARASDAHADPNAWAQVAADASVRSDTPDVALQADLDLVSNAVQRSFVAFRLPNTTDGRIVSATLLVRLNLGQTTPRGRHEVAVVGSDAWSDATLTWNTQPAAAIEPVGVVDVAALAPATEARIDVSAAAIAEQAAERGIGFRIAPETGSPNADLRFRPRERGPSFELELVLDPAPRLATGDLVSIEPRPIEAIIASDPNLLLRKRLGRLIAPGRFSQLARDPVDGSWIALESQLTVPWHYLYRILRVDPLSGALRVIYESERLSASSLLTVAPDGSIWTSLHDYDGTTTYALARIDRETGEATDVSSGGLLGTPTALIVDATGSSAYWALYGTTVEPGAIVRIDTQTGAQSIAAAGGFVQGSRALAFGAASELWVVDAGEWSAPELVRIDLGSGAQTRVGALPLNAGQLAYEPSGTLVVASLRDIYGSAAWIARFDPVSGAWTSRLEDPDANIGGIVVDADGSWTVGITDSSGVRVSRIDPGVPSETPLHGWIAVDPYWWPMYLAIDARRQLVVLQGFSPGASVVRIDPRSGLQDLITTTRQLLPSNPVTTSSPAAIRLAADGRIYFAQHFETSSEVYEVDAAGSRMLRFTTPGIPSSFVIARDGAILVATSGAATSQLQRVDPSTGAITSPASPIPFRFARLDLGPGGELFASNAGRVVRLHEEDGAWQEVASTALTTRSFMLDGTGKAWSEFCHGSDSSAMTTRLDLATGVAERLPLCGALAVVRPRCADTLDNDRNGAVDWPADAACSAAADDAERPRGCGLGAELVLLVIALDASLRRTRRGWPQRSRATSSEP